MPTYGNESNKVAASAERDMQERTGYVGLSSVGIGQQTAHGTEIEIHRASDEIDKRAQAEQVTASIRSSVDNLRRSFEDLANLVEMARKTEAWVTLGYDSWADYLADVTSVPGMKLDKQHRKEMVQLLTGEGISNRKIAQIVGADEGTIRNDKRALDRAENSALPAKHSDSDSAPTDHTEKHTEEEETNVDDILSTGITDLMARIEGRKLTPAQAEALELLAYAVECLTGTGAPVEDAATDSTTDSTEQDAEAVEAVEEDATEEGPTGGEGATLDVATPVPDATPVQEASTHGRGSTHIDAQLTALGMRFDPEGLPYFDAAVLAEQLGEQSTEALVERVREIRSDYASTDGDTLPEMGFYAAILTSRASNTAPVVKLYAFQMARTVREGASYIAPGVVPAVPIDGEWLASHAISAIKDLKVNSNTREFAA